MAKKKVNVRKDYSYEAKKGAPQYARSKIPRKITLLVLHGPSLNLLGLNELNVEIKAFAKLKHVKVKILQSNSDLELIRFLKESITWATAAIFNPGTVTPDSPELKMTLKKMIIPTQIVRVEITDKDSVKEAYLEGINELISKLR